MTEWSKVQKWGRLKIGHGGAERKWGMKQNSKKQKLKIGAVLLGVMLCLSGCGSSNSNGFYVSKSADSAGQVRDGSAMDTGFGVLSDSVSYESASYEESTGRENAETGVSVKDTGRKLIKNVDMTVETKEFDALLKQLEVQIEQAGGYVENKNTYNGSAYNEWRSARSCSMTIRIPRDQLDGFLKQVTGLCNVIRSSESEEDVTLTYVDLKSHKEALQTEQKRLMTLLEQAESVEDIITIEERLSDVRYQIESMESQLRTYDNLVDYSTVSLDIDEVAELTPVKEETALERIGSGFKKSLHSVGSGIAEFFIWVVIHIPQIVLTVILVLLAFFLIRRLQKSKKKRIEKIEKKLSPGTPRQDDNNTQKTEKK